jgi:hypothetical protein
MKKEEFRRAVRNLERDPKRLAELLRLFPSTTKSRQLVRNNNNNNESIPVSLQENGTDWSGVVTAWLDACDALEAVSDECLLHDTIFGRRRDLSGLFG